MKDNWGNFTGPVEALEQLKEVTQELVVQACTCDLMYGIHCSIHQYERLIDDLYKEIKKAITNDANS